MKAAMTLPQTSKRRRLACVALFGGILLSGCGFQLRGTGNQPELPFKTMFLGFPETSPLGIALRRNLAAADRVKVVNDRTQADAALEVLAEARDKQVLSLNSQGRVREYNLFYRLNFRVVDREGRELLPPSQIVIRRIQPYNENQALAKEVEEAQMYREMQNDVVQQVLRRIASIKPPAA
jgi:LPS-assembly lipoprotein